MTKAISKYCIEVMPLVIPTSSGFTGFAEKSSPYNTYLTTHEAFWRAV